MIKNVVNVLEYGADPSGKTESIQAFRDAFLAGRSVLIPAGRYMLNGLVKISDEVPEEETEVDSIGE